MKGRQLRPVSLLTITALASLNDNIKTNNDRFQLNVQTLTLLRGTTVTITTWRL